MDAIPRMYGSAWLEHFARYRQMLFVGGARQVGKTFSCRALLADPAHYLNWDNLDDRTLLLRGPAALAAHLGLDRLAATPPLVVLDELHKFPKWKTLLKGFFDSYGERVRIIITGSARFDVLRRGGDSLMGRFFPWRLHPLSVGELCAPVMPDPARLIRPPLVLAEPEFAALLAHGGFPEPFLHRDPGFTTRWRNLRFEQLVRGDLRELTRLQELAQLEVFASLLSHRPAMQLNYTALARDVRVSVDTIRRWLPVLAAMHFGFELRPWSRNITNSLKKEPKWYLGDWSGIADPGSRAENFIACHLLKAVETWTDCGGGRFSLHYLRDKQQHEVDFLVTRDDEPWFLAEVKTAARETAPALSRFQAATGAPYAFQVELDAPYVAADCFAAPGGPPLRVPARTLLSQLP